MRGTSPGSSGRSGTSLENADRYGGGPVRVGVERRERAVRRSRSTTPDRVFRRPNGRASSSGSHAGAGAARRSLPGAGLGLAIVTETAAQHGGAAWCADEPVRRRPVRPVAAGSPGVTARRLRGLAVAGAVVAAVTACGVPTGGGPTILSASDVPYGLASPATPTPAPSSGPEQERAWIYLVGPDDALVPRGRDPAGAPSRRCSTSCWPSWPPGPPAGSGPPGWPPRCRRASG